ncbi:TPA_asm: P3 [Erysimum trirhavirus 1]|nr:TPA_asm: P3 [Erysimum trirhavirus 1]
MDMDTITDRIKLAAGNATVGLNPESIGTTAHVNCSIRLFGLVKLDLGQIRQLIDHFLTGPFSTQITNKQIQELLIYGFYKQQPPVSHGSTRTYEWGDDTKTTSCLWNFSVSGTSAIVRMPERFQFPVEKMITVDSHPMKVTYSLEIELKPLYRSLKNSEAIPNGYIFPVLTIPEIIKRFRASHEKRAIHSMLKPDKPT